MAEPEANPAYDSAAAEELAEVTDRETLCRMSTIRETLHRHCGIVAAMSKLDATAGGGTTDSGGLDTLARHVDGWHDHLATLAEEGPPEARDSFMAYTKASRARSQLQMHELVIQMHEELHLNHLLQMKEMMMKKMKKMQLQMMQQQLQGASIPSSTWDMYEQQMQQMQAPE